MRAACGAELAALAEDGPSRAGTARSSERLIAEGLRTSDRTRASTSSFPTRRFASWTKKRPPGPSGHSTPKPSPSDVLAGEASQRRRRRTPGELSCPCAGPSGVGQGVLPGRFLPSPLEHPRKQSWRGPTQTLLLTLAFRNYATAGTTQSLAAGGRRCGALTSVPAR